MDVTRILLGLLLSTAIGAVAYRRRSLTASGWIGAILTGTATFGFGGWPHGVTLVFFFVSSTLWSQVKKHQKATLEAVVYEKGSHRDIWQALANGGLPAALCIAMPFLPEQTTLINTLFAAAMATVAADTWATELGVLFGGVPRLITTLKEAPKGTSGAVSIPGTLAALAAACAVACVFAVCNGSVTAAFIARITAAGLVGSLLDSLLGATVQRIYQGPHGYTEKSADEHGNALPLVRGWRWMTNDVVNFLSAVAGAALAGFSF